jgi:quercetin dioxygenase-like cupin family protein
MQPEHWNPQIDGRLSEEALRRKLETMGYAVQRYVYPPGTQFPPHHHEVDKIDAVLDGEFVLEMAGQRVILRAGDWIAIPRGVVHSAAVAGSRSVISLDAVRISPTGKA